MTERKRLMLIDGHALAYRAYHAIPPLTSPSGEPTNATFGYANMLLKAIADYAPDYVVATFDAGPSFRQQEYQEYKANRAETPDDAQIQFERIRELTEKLGIPIYALPGYEADDLLGTLARQAEEQGLETIIVTGDGDTLQLVSEQVKVLMPRRTFGDVMLYDLDAVRERYGLEPAQLVDYKALVGDPSDNIPGVRGIGDKTAIRLLQEYGSLEGIYAHLNEIKSSRFRSALEEGHDAAFLSKRLATIVRDVDIALDLKKSHWGHFNREEVMDLLRKLGFRSLVTRIPGGSPPSGQQLGLFADLTQEEAPSLGDYHCVNSAKALDRLIIHLLEALERAPTKLLALDTETTGTDAMRAKLVGISLSAKPGVGYYIPIGHDDALAGCSQLDLEIVRAKLGPLLADERIGKVMHNAKFDLIILARHGLPVAGPLHDTLVAAWLLSPSGRGIGLKEQAWQHLGIEMTGIEELIGSGRNQITMAQVRVSKAAPYAGADADVTLRLLDVLRPELEARNQWKLFAEMEMPLIPVLVDMEMHGMVIDVEYLDTMSEVINDRLDELTADVYRLAGHEFNISSTQQLGEVLFDELGLKVIRRTKTGYSTAQDVLEELAGEHEIVAKILEYRQYEKLRSTYVDALRQLINPDTGRIHTSFNQTATSTGRLSSSDPNLQNIPVRTELGRQVRRAFIAPEGHVLLGCDYSQVELRVLAHVSQDPEMLAAFSRDEDVHATTAAAIFGVPLQEVTPEQRSLAKSINFGLMYGMSSFGLAARTDLDIAQAEQFIANYFRRFRQVKEYLENTIRQATEKGYVETIMGRRRYFPELTQPQVNPQIRRAAERAAVNMPIQGSAADIIKLASIDLHRKLKELGLRSALVLQVHDELVLEVPEEELDQARELTVDTMSHAYELSVPLKVEVGVGKNWMEMKK
ncbi:MAG: DNA polymerase I [Chloroflexi bacterium]|nr:DNA polymerase I [Chloroflexota bacterium]